MKRIISIAVCVVAICSFLSGNLLAQNTSSNAPAKQLKAVPLTGYEHRDIGNPLPEGKVNITGGVIDVYAGGEDIWGTKDEFNFVYVEKTGDFDIVTQVEDMKPAHLYSKAGIMAREGLTPSCRHIFFQVFSDNNPRNKNNGGYEFQYRMLRDSSMKAIYPKSAVGKAEFPVKYPNVWIRLQRVKNDFTGYYSNDGKTWKPYTTYKLELPARVFVGLALTSHNPSQSASARFKNFAELK